MLKWTVKKRLTDEELKIFNNGNNDDENATVVRKIHSRRSLGDALNDENRDRRKHKTRLMSRRSLGNFQSHDKENEGEKGLKVINRLSSTPLNDSSNVHKSYKRKHHMMSTVSSPSISPISIATFKEPAVIFRSNQAPTLPSYDIEYSPVLIKPVNPIIPKHLNLSAISSEEVFPLPTKRLKFDTPCLDMSYEFKPESISTSSPLSTPLTTRKFFQPPLNVSSVSESSLNSSECGDNTLQKMIDDILASARHGKKFKKCFPATKSMSSRCDQNSNFVKPLSIVCETMEQKSIENLLSSSKIAQAAERTLIIADEAKNEREIKSPIKNDETILCPLKRQNAVRRKNNSNENKNRKNPNESLKEGANQDSTIQKCLSFSSANYDDISEKLKTSTTSSSISSSCGSSYISQSKYSKNMPMKGSIEIATSYDESKAKISIHVIKCQNLMKINETCQINAYVKCALTSVKTSTNQAVYQRTAVHKSSLNPIFDHTFEFELNLPKDDMKYFQVAVWHRNKILKRSEFLGCLMISVHDILSHYIQGSFLLQSQSSLNNPKPVVREIEDDTQTVNNQQHLVNQIKEAKNSENLELFKYLELNTNDSTAYTLEGRTPLTVTKIIARLENGSFGFEISWTKPPKINSICSEQSKSGIKRGDFIIFINDKNIVSMPKDEIVELIKMQKNCLRMEIFRPTEKTSCNEMIESLAAQNTPNFKNSLQENIIDISNTPKSHKSYDFLPPKICFQPSIGSGIFV